MLFAVTVEITEPRMPECRCESYIVDGVTTHDSETRVLDYVRGVLALGGGLPFPNYNIRVKYIRASLEDLRKEPVLVAAWFE